MITAVIRGGLGNQLFQYASAYALAKRMNQELILDISFYPKQTLRGFKLDKLSLTDLQIKKDTRDELRVKLYKNRNINGLIRRLPIKTLPIRNGLYLIDHAGGFSSDFFTINTDNVFLNGYFQSEEYFHNMKSDLLNQFQPIYKTENEYIEILSEIQSVNAIAVHIRHGDFINGDGSKYHYILGTDYYNRAIHMMKMKTNKPVFFCFSDDIEWVKANVGEAQDFRFISLKTSHADIDEMMLMKNCRHIITANSTFSWWAAWLNENENAIRIVPDKAYGNEHMIPATWLKIPVE